LNNKAARVTAREIFEMGYEAAHAGRHFVARGNAKDREIFAHGMSLGFLDRDARVLDAAGAWAEYQVKKALARRVTRRRS
jgi:hypothetical protein